MREVRIGEKTIRVRATALALLYYRQEFKSDFIGDLTKLQYVENDVSQFDSMVCLQITWAMAKADNYGKPFPPFETWLAELDSIDFGDGGFLLAVLEEAGEGFFRGSSSEAKPKPKGRRS